MNFKRSYVFAFTLMFLTSIYASSQIKLIESNTNKVLVGGFNHKDSYGDLKNMSYKGELSYEIRNKKRFYTLYIQKTFYNNFRLPLENSCYESVSFYATQNEINSMYNTFKRDMINKNTDARTEYELGSKRLLFFGQILTFVDDLTPRKNEYLGYLNIDDCFIKLDLAELRKLFNKS